MLIEAGADVNKADNFSTPLVISACYGHVEVVEALLAAGADVNKADNNGLTPSLRTMNKGSNVACMNAVIQAGANLNCDLLIATTRCHPDRLQLLLQNGVDVNMQDYQGRTALMAAAGSGDYESITVLLEAGANVNCRDDTGETALSVAAMDVNRHINEYLQRMTIEKGPTNVDGDQVGPMKDHDRKISCLECIKTLLKAGADVNMKNDTDITALMSAAAAGLPECVDVLLEAGPHVNTKDNGYLTAFIYGAMASISKTVISLLKAGADVNITDKRNKTALIYATDGGYHDCVQALLDAGADVNVTDHQGEENSNGSDGEWRRQDHKTH